MTDEEWIKLYNYLSDYAYVYLFSTDSIVKVLSSELFSFLIARFDGRAKALLGQTSKATEFLKYRKYSYLSGRGTEIPMIFQSFKLSEGDRILPKFATSFVFEFWQFANTSLAATFDPSNYYLRIFLDDQPLKMPQAECDKNFRCSWSSVRAFMEPRIYSAEELDQICFSHMDYSDGQDRKQWLVAFLIAFPMVAVTVFLSRCVFCKGRPGYQQEERYRYEQVPNNEDIEG